MAARPQGKRQAVLATVCEPARQQRVTPPNQWREWNPERKLQGFSIGSPLRRLKDLKTLLALPFGTESVLKRAHFRRERRSAEHRDQQRLGKVKESTKSMF